MQSELKRKEKSQSMNGNCFVLTPVWLVQLIITCVIFIHRNISHDKEQLCRQQLHNSAIFMVSSSILCWIMNWGCSFQNKHLIYTFMSMEKICHNYGIIWKEWEHCPGGVDIYPLLVSNLIIIYIGKSV